MRASTPSGVRPFRETASDRDDDMSKTILLAVDTARHDLGEHVSAVVEMIRDLVHADDRVIVLHVHEFAFGRFGHIVVRTVDVVCAIEEAIRIIEAYETPAAAAWLPGATSR